LAGRRILKGLRTQHDRKNITEAPTPSENHHQKRKLSISGLNFGDWVVVVILGFNESGINLNWWGNFGGNCKNIKTNNYYFSITY